jgi:CRP/FNR family cyclic AMP-dependent transcriptional regulator
MDPDRVTKLLAKCELFNGLSDASLKRLAAGVVPRTFDKARTIFHEGDEGSLMYIITEGKVKVFVTAPDAREMVMTTLGAGEVFGELALLDGGSRSASVQAIERVSALSLDRATMLDALAHDRAATDHVLHALGELIRRLTEQASDLVFLDLNGRVAKLLLGFVQREGIEHDGHQVVDLPLTQGEIAEAVGGSRQSVNQALRYLQVRGAIETDARRITVLDLSLLEKLAHR